MYLAIFTPIGAIDGIFGYGSPAAPRAVKDDHFDVLVSFNRCDDFVELRNRCRAEDVERRMIKRYSPILG